MFNQGDRRTFKLGMIAGIFLLTSPVQAISLSTYRIYLDSDNSSTSFVVDNRELIPQNCRLNLVHYDFDETGKMSKVDLAITPDNSASPWLRFSPKNFTTAPLSAQTVRFTLRRKAKSIAQEYRSYLEIYCDSTAFEKPRSGNGSFSVKPRLVPHVPIIVRTGKLSAQLEMSNFSVEHGKVLFTLNRYGERSIYGEVQLINRQTNEVINRRKNISLYLETKQIELELATGGTPPDQLAIRFVEDEKYGGDLTYQQDVVLN